MNPFIAFGWPIVLMVLPAGSSVMPETLPSELQGVPRAWVANQWTDLQSEAVLLIEAYELKGDLRQAFWHDYYSQWAEQYFYETAYLSESIVGLSGDEVMRRLTEFAGHMPTNLETLGLLAESLLPVSDHSLQRRRLEELRSRRDQRMWIHEEQVIRRNRLRRLMKRLRLMRVNLTDHGHPMPIWVHARSRQELAARLSREEERAATQREAARLRAIRDPSGGAVRRKQPERANKEPSQAADEPLVVSAFDTTLRMWRGYLEKITEDEGLPGNRLAGAENTFSQMWKRALAFRATQRAAYLDLEKLSSCRAFAEALARLDAPLRPLFEEFKLRLDSQARAAR